MSEYKITKNTTSLSKTKKEGKEHFGKAFIGLN